MKRRKTKGLEREKREGEDRGALIRTARTWWGGETMRFVMRGGRVTAGRAEGTAGWAEEKKTTIISGCFQELPHTPAPAPSNRLLPGDRCTPRPEMCSCSSSWRRCLFLSKVPKQASQHRRCRTWAENSSVKWGDISSSWKLEEVRSTFRRSSVEHLAWWMIFILVNTQHTAYKYMNNNTGDRVKTEWLFEKVCSSSEPLAVLLLLVATTFQSLAVVCFNWDYWNMFWPLVLWNWNARQD